MKYVLAAAILAASFTGFSSAYAQESEAQEPAGMDASGEQGVKSFYTTTKEKEEDKKIIKGPAGSEGGSIFKGPDPLEAVSGTVPLSDVEFYNLYERQVRYKKSDKDFRNSIEARRVAFEAPNATKFRESQAKISKIYIDENDKSMKAQEAADSGVDDKMLGSVDPAEAPMPPKPADNRPQVPVGEPGDGMEQAPEKLKDQQAKAETGDKTGIKEIDVSETEQVGEPETEKKVVVPADAPDFEKSPF